MKTDKIKQLAKIVHAGYRCSLCDGHVKLDWKTCKSCGRKLESLTSEPTTEESKVVEEVEKNIIKELDNYIIIPKRIYFPKTGYEYTSEEVTLRIMKIITESKKGE